MKSNFTRTLSIVLALVSLFAFSSCEIDNWFDVKQVLGIEAAEPEDSSAVVKTPAELYSEWLSQLGSHENARISAIYDASDNENTMNVIYSVEYDADKRYQKSAYTYIDQSDLSESWYSEGHVYHGGYKSLMNMEEYDETVDILKADFIDESMIALPEKWLENVSWSKNDAGLLYAEISVTKEQYTEAFPEGMLSDAFTSDDAALTYVIALNEDASMESLSVLCSAEQEDAVLTVKISLEITNVGKTSVALPEEAENWSYPNSSENNSDGSSASSPDSGSDSSSASSSGSSSDSSPDSGSGSSSDGNSASSPDSGSGSGSGNDSE